MARIAVELNGFKNQIIEEKDLVITSINRSYITDEIFMCLTAKEGTVFRIYITGEELEELRRQFYLV